MKRSKTLLSLALLVGVALCMFSTTDVYGIWVYFQPTSPIDYQEPFVMGEFGYIPEEILPGGDEEVQPGQDHYNLIDCVLNENTLGFGLNEGSLTVLHWVLSRDGKVYCNQYLTGAYINLVLNISNNTYGLYFCLEKIDNKTYYMYTFELDSVLAAAGTQEEIAVYRTSLVKTNQWKAEKSYLGYAKTVSLKTLGIRVSSSAQEYTIDMSTWHI